MSQCQGPEQRAEFALQLLLNHVRAQSGFLFAYDKEQLKLVAPHHGQEPATEIMSRIQADIASHLQDDEATVVTRAPGSTSMPPPMPDAEIKQTYRTFVLTLPGLTEPYVVGAIAVAVDLTARPLRQPLKTFTEAIARSLFEAGDAGSVTETQTATKTSL
jgi:hypothetical protein